ncbi:uncharacterized protein LOC114439084 [Parambassis ranga]|uniref:Uncharacterized protein LOC114439084 n=1 Tax=Parambassis ranga TaxID=210632 RepID=A0A6P7IMC1_9TELE|nr:uncharacterized protein LOC114439084 [Parambassis ranga]XP_028266633.1 uncharacterized protein LOC114439084 [Parambassis ranga]
MEGFADLLTDAFSETSVPSFPDGDLDFENLNFDEKCEEEKIEDLTTKKDEALLQEAADETAHPFGRETKDVSYMAECAEEDIKDEEVLRKTPEEDYTSSSGESEQEGSVSEDDEDDEKEGAAEKPGDLWTSVCCSDKFTDDNEEHSVIAEGQPAAPQGDENSQVRNKEQSDSEGDEEVPYIKRGSEIMIKEQDSEEEDSSDLECEGTDIQQEENVLGQCFDVESPFGDNPAKATSDSPCTSMQSLQNLITEVDGEEHVEKIKDFSGEEHQEAGESFADYPSDLSSIEYVDDGGKSPQGRSDALPGADCGSHAEMTWRESPVKPDKMEECLHSGDLEAEADVMSLDMAVRRDILTECLDEDEERESDSYSSSDNEVRRNIEELLDYDFNKQQDDTQVYSGSSSEGHHITNNRPQPDFLSWDFDVLKTDDLLSEYFLNTEDKVETLPSDVSQAEGINSYSVVQQGGTKTLSPSYRGSVDDSFFFTSDLDTSELTEEGQLGDDEYEDDRNWEQEQERIKAFNRFYDDCDEENGRAERQTKVQFCADPLSQVNYYETDSSDRDSLSSSTDMEEDLSSADVPDELSTEDTLQMKPDYEPADIQLPESVPDDSIMHTQTEQHKCANILKLILKMCVVTVMGLLMFWLITDQGDWLSEAFF